MRRAGRRTLGGADSRGTPTLCSLRLCAFARFSLRAWAQDEGHVDDLCVLTLEAFFLVRRPQRTRAG